MTPDLDTCRWCGGAHPIEFCPDVLAAFVRGHDPYQGNASSSAATNPRKFRGKALARRRKARLAQGATA